MIYPGLGAGVFASYRSRFCPFGSVFYFFNNFLYNNIRIH